MRYFVGGVNGSGKTTFLNRLHAERPDWSIVHSSTGLMEHLGIGGDYGALRGLPRGVVNERFSEFMENLLDTQDINDLVVDAHYLNLVGGEVYEVIRGDWIARFGALVLVTASAQEIFNRIEMESGVRDRALFRPDSSSEERYEVLSRYLADTEAYCRELAVRHQVPFVLLSNTEGKLDEIVHDFLATDQSLRQNSSIS